MIFDFEYFPCMNGFNFGKPTKATTRGCIKTEPFGISVWRIVHKDIYKNPKHCGSININSIIFKVISQVHTNRQQPYSGNWGGNVYTVEKKLPFSIPVAIRNNTMNSKKDEKWQNRSKRGWWRKSLLFRNKGTSSVIQQNKMFFEQTSSIERDSNASASSAGKLWVD